MLEIDKALEEGGPERVGELLRELWEAESRNQVPEPDPLGDDDEKRMRKLLERFWKNG
jgi:hypothetical protein